MTWEKNLVHEGDSLYMAANVLNESNLKLALVVAKSGELKGTVSDGDLRRAVLRGQSLDDRVDTIMNRGFVAGRGDMSKSDLRLIMSRKQVSYLPVIDEVGHVVDLISQQPDSIIAKGTFVIMAGGRGTRLMPLTESTPKPMLRVNSKPILEHILVSAVRQGFQKIVISVNYLSEQIESYFGDGSNWGVTIEYLRESQALGTAGALSLLPCSTETPIVVVNGDIITSIDYRAMIENHNLTKAIISMAVRRFELRNPYGVVLLDGDYVQKIDEKPTYVSQVNTGVYVLSNDALSLLQPNTFHNMTDLVESAIDLGRLVAAFPVHESWMDIGTPNDFHAANET